MLAAAAGVGLVVLFVLGSVEGGARTDARPGPAAAAACSSIAQSRGRTHGRRKHAPAKPARPRPVSTGARWFSPKSPLNTPIRPDAVADPASQEMVAALAADAQSRGFAVAVNLWTVPVYYATRSSPLFDVRLTASWRPADSMVKVPIPSGAAPDASADGHMAVIDSSSGCFYEFYVAHYDSGGWSANWANRGRLTGSGIQPGGYSTRDSGFSSLAGLIRPSELKAGVIRHALAFTTTYTLPDGFVSPATSGNGHGEPPTGARDLPEGARVQLDPSLDLSTLGLKPWQRTIARALQVYGMYLVDTGSLSLFAINPRSFPTNPYASLWGDDTYAYLPNSLVGHLRVLRLGRLERR